MPDDMLRDEFVESREDIVQKCREAARILCQEMLKNGDFAKTGSVTHNTAVTSSFQNTFAARMAEKLKNTVAAKKVEKLKNKLATATMRKQRAMIQALVKFNIIQRGGKFSCRKCPFISGYLSRAKRHVLTCEKIRRVRIKKAKSLSCIHCPEMVAFPSKRLLNKHWRTMHSIVFTCTKCITLPTFRYKSSLLRHMKINHSGSPTPLFSCDVCEYVVNLEWNLIRHKKKHEKENLLAAAEEAPGDTEEPSVEEQPIDLEEAHGDTEDPSVEEQPLEKSVEEEDIIEETRAETESVLERMENARERVRMEALAECERLFPSDNWQQKSKPRNVKKPTTVVPVRRSPRLPSDRATASEATEVSDESVDLVNDESVSDHESVDDVAVENTYAAAVETEEVLVDENTVAVMDDPEENVDGAEGAESYTCTICGYESTKHNFNLSRHMRKQHEELAPPIKCPRPYCTKTFLTRYEKTQHVVGCFLTCTICGHKTIRGDKFEAHQRMHKAVELKMAQWFRNQIFIPIFHFPGTFFP